MEANNGAKETKKMSKFIVGNHEAVRFLSPLNPYKPSVQDLMIYTELGWHV